MYWNVKDAFTRAFSLMHLFKKFNERNQFIIRIECENDYTNMYSTSTFLLH